MKKASIYIALLLAIVAGTTSCRKDIPSMIAPEDYQGNDFSSVFEAFWTGMNHNYLFWDIDTTDWDKMYETYQPLFAQLDVNNDDDIYKGYSYFKEMTAGLSDGHYALMFNSYLLKDSIISPSVIQRKRAGVFHNSLSPQYFMNQLAPKYLNTGYITGSTNSDYGMLHAVSGTINGEILYLYFSNFFFNALSEAEQVRMVIDYFKNKLKTTSGIKGIIVDVRSNGGGSVADVYELLGALINKTCYIGYTRSKMGEGRLDYTPWTPFTVEPAKGNRQLNMPIVVLADLHSASCAEFTTMAIASLPNGYFIGERTWGAQGPLTENTIYNGGQFSTAFMELVYTSSLMTKYIDGKVYEGTGFPPDIEVKYNAEAFAAGQDLQLEAAIELINSK